MAKMIDQMPKVWRMVGRVHGITLSQEKFQFIFQREEDLLSVLADRPWTYDHWTMIMEHWIPDPLEDFLTSFEVWVRIRNILMNHFTIETMNTLGKVIGRVEEIAYDATESLQIDFVRVKVHLKITDPARSTKNLTIPSGEVVVIQYEYEKLRKRCFHCLRLTHEKARCPLLKKPRGLLKPEVSESLRSVGNKDLRGREASEPRALALTTPPGFAPIFPGLSREENIVAQQYVSHADPTKRNARIIRVQQGLQEKSGESPTPQPRITSNVERGKGQVYAYEEEGTLRRSVRAKTATMTKLTNFVIEDPKMDGVEAFSDAALISEKEKVPLAFTFVAAAPGTQEDSSLMVKKERKRPVSWKRKTQQQGKAKDTTSASIDPGVSRETLKRKLDTETNISSNKNSKNMEIAVASSLKPLLPE
ncbi:hypothetical protein V5N11_028930 [Cardamine amara subsp. amara]|uniref:DUF4283 domain-containing protein n=1 Tax=Cardamine amara subsp. amara TaxID=228776 RepID=A0ABD1BLW5_CARAN